MQRLIAITVLFSYLAGLYGFLPVYQASPARERGFICAEHACGCTNAEVCWANCCCYSLAKRLAWAEEHQVQPPDWVTANAEPRASCCHAAPLERTQPPTSCHADRARAREDARLPAVAPLSCRGLQSWMQVAPPASSSPQTGLLLTEPMQRGWLPIALLVRVPSAMIEIPTPPPRTLFRAI